MSESSYAVRVLRARASTPLTASSPPKSWTRASRTADNELEK
jgi:hypothetical protein